MYNLLSVKKYLFCVKKEKQLTEAHTINKKYKFLKY